MKKLLLTLSALFLICTMSAQSHKNVVENQFSVNFLLPGVVYESGISENATLATELTIGFAYRESAFFGDGFGIYPIGRFQYRNYYNFERRLNKGKRISGNTGNYLAPTFAIQSGRAIVGDLDFSSDYIAGLGLVYGLQRTAPKGFQFRFEAGPSYFFDEYDNGFGIMLAVKLGWVIRKQQ